MEQDSRDGVQSRVGPDQPFGASSSGALVDIPATGEHVRLATEVALVGRDVRVVRFGGYELFVRQMSARIQELSGFVRTARAARPSLRSLRRLPSPTGCFTATRRLSLRRRWRADRKAALQREPLLDLSEQCAIPTSKRAASD